MFFRIGVLNNFANFTRKHLCWSLFINNVADLKTYNCLKKRLHHKCFSAKFVTFLRTPFFYRTPPVAAFDLLKVTALKRFMKGH